MKSIKKIALFILILVMLIPSIIMVHGLSDIEKSVYKAEIEKLAEEGVIDGYPDGTFKPEANIKRGEFAKILAVALKLELNSDIAAKYDDVRGRWHEGYIGAIVNKGLMIGRSNDIFDPESSIAKEELAIVLVRAFDLEEILDGIEDIEVDIDDIGNVADWAKKYVILVTSIGLMDLTETEDGNVFLPKEHGNRQLVAKLTYELLLNREAYDDAIEELKLSIELSKPIKEDKTEEDKTGDTKDDDTKTLEEPKDPEQSEEPEKPEESEKPEEPEISEPEKPSESEIVSKYYSQLSSLQSDVESELDSLVSQAFGEIKAGKSFGEVFDKYEAIARDLEASTDSAVSSIVSSMEKELAENGYDTGAAADLYSEYESIKEHKSIEISH